MSPVEITLCVFQFRRKGNCGKFYMEHNTRSMTFAQNVSIIWCGSTLNVHETRALIHLEFSMSVECAKVPKHHVRFLTNAATLSMKKQMHAKQLKPRTIVACMFRTILSTPAHIHILHARHDTTQHQKQNTIRCCCLCCNKFHFHFIHSTAQQHTEQFRAFAKKDAANVAMSRTKRWRASEREIACEKRMPMLRSTRSIEWFIHRHTHTFAFTFVFPFSPEINSVWCAFHCPFSQHRNICHAPMTSFYSDCLSMDLMNSQKYEHNRLALWFA